MIETTVDGRYQIIARIAAGGMGEVFRAHDPVLNREVAVKVLHGALAGDADFIDRFRREARAAAMLSHPNIVAVHDWGRTDDIYFMVMEYVQGPNLRALLTHGGPLPPAQAAEAVSQVLAALSGAHDQGIVHRDVKPENILVTRDGVVKVADFGLARALAESRVTHAPGTVTGTVQYLAPEQIQGEQADPRTDLYATGIVLYELLVGRVPFTGETSVAIAYKHLQEPVPPPSRANPMVPSSLDRVVARATEKDRARRVASADDMRRLLAASTAELPPAAPLPELAESVPPADEVPPDRAPTVTIPRALSRKARRRRMLGRLSRILAVLVLLAAAGWALWTYVIPHRTDTPGVAGLTVAQAQRRADDAGLELVVARQVFSSDVESGLIVSQRPPPGARVERGAELVVEISKGPRLVDVPGVSGLPVSEARQRLRDAGLDPDVRRVYDDEVPKGRVVAQNPSAGTELEVGKPVELTVSRGPRPVSVPDVEGRRGKDAEALLVAAGLGVEVREEFSETVRRGDVISQEPPAGNEIPVGSTVTIVVSKGPLEFPMPSLIGLTEEAATARLADLGLGVRVIRLPGSAGNTVVGQRPKAGKTVRVGEQVTIFVGGG